MKKLKLTNMEKEIIEAFRAKDRPGYVSLFDARYPDYGSIFMTDEMRRERFGIKMPQKKKR